MFSSISLSSINILFVCDTPAKCQFVCVCVCLQVSDRAWQVLCPVAQSSADCWSTLTLLTTTLRTCECSNACICKQCSARPQTSSPPPQTSPPPHLSAPSLPPLYTSLITLSFICSSYSLALLPVFSLSPTPLSSPVIVFCLGWCWLSCVYIPPAVSPLGSGTATRRSAWWITTLGSGWMPRSPWTSTTRGTSTRRSAGKGGWGGGGAKRNCHGWGPAEPSHNAQRDGGLSFVFRLIRLFGFGL